MHAIHPPPKTDSPDQFFFYEGQQSAAELECEAKDWLPITKGGRRGCHHIITIGTYFQVIYRGHNERSRT